MSHSELDRIRSGPAPGQRIGGLGTIRIVAHCAGNSEEVLRKAKEILALVVSSGVEPEIDLSDWQSRFPTWFLTQFVPEPTAEENAKYLSLPYEERIEPENNPWDLRGWLYWFQVENRCWFWWDAALPNEDTVVVAIEVTEWPFAWNSLQWLLQASGATSVQAEP